jgi:hypothetical protein
MPKWYVARFPDPQLFLQPVKANHFIRPAIRRSGDPAKKAPVVLRWILVVFLSHSGNGL